MALLSLAIGCELRRGRYAILPFDQNASLVAAKLRSNKELIKSCRANGKTKNCIKSDINICATARAHEVDLIISDNTTDIGKFAQLCGQAWAPLFPVGNYDHKDPANEEGIDSLRQRGLFK